MDSPRPLCLGVGVIVFRKEMRILIQLMEISDLERSLPTGESFDERLATWAVETVSAAALQIVKRPWNDSLDVPPGAAAIIALATRRLYTNPDRFTRESEGDYSYTLDASVTGADIFTPNERAELAAIAGTPARIKGIGTVGTVRGDVFEPAGGWVRDQSGVPLRWYGEGDV